MKRYTNEDVKEIMFSSVRGEISKADKERIFKATWNGIANALKRNGDKVCITGFGTFRVVKTAERNSRNPRTGETLVAPPTLRVRFKCSKKQVDRKKSS